MAYMRQEMAGNGDPGGISCHLNDLLEAGCCLDWISPILAALRDARYAGRVLTFAIAEDGGWSEYDIRHILGPRGIDVWGFMFLAEYLLFSVPEDKAEWAIYLLRQAGVPLFGAVKTEHSQRSSYSAAAVGSR